MKKSIILFTLVCFALAFISAGPVQLSVSPGAKINIQNDYALPDLTIVDKASIIYADATVSLDVDVVAGFGLGFRFGVPFPISLVADGTKYDSSFNGLSMGMELMYQYALSEKWAIGAVAGIYQYAIPVDKTTTTTVGSQTIRTTYDPNLYMISIYGGLTGTYSFTDHLRAGIAVRVGKLSDAALITKKIETTESGVTTTEYERERISQSGLLIYPALSVSYRF